MLSNANLQSIICTCRLDEAEKFYRDTLGLVLKNKSDGSLVFDVNGGNLWVAPVPSTTPTEHTVLGFSVSDVSSVVSTLAERGVVVERFEGFSHEPDGVLTTPGGSRVAWFRDLDGNLLSVVQLPQSR